LNTEQLAGAKWRKSSHSNGQAECVEVAFLRDGRVAMRDSKNPDGPMLAVDVRGLLGTFANRIHPK